MFRDREDAGRRLAAVLKGRRLHEPLVLAIPRGGVATGIELARRLGADFDVVLARKLRAPGQPEVAMGAISENGALYLNDLAGLEAEGLQEYLARERVHQMAEMARRKLLIRNVQPAAPLKGRTVIVTDDGIATGSTMIAALQAARTQGPRELIVAVPVAAPDRLAEIGQYCDEVISLLTPEWFSAVGQFYEDFRQVSDQEMLGMLKDFRSARSTTPARPA